MFCDSSHECTVEFNKPLDCVHLNTIIPLFRLDTRLLVTLGEDKSEWLAPILYKFMKDSWKY